MIVAKVIMPKKPVMSIYFLWELELLDGVLVLFVSGYLVVTVLRVNFIIKKNRISFLLPPQYGRLVVLRVEGAIPR